MSCHSRGNVSQMETSCGSLLNELQVIWVEIGESEEERDRLLLEVEQECLEVYRKKVNQANRLRAELRQAVADSEAELATICSALGEAPMHFRKSDQNSSSLKEELAAIGPQLEELRRKKIERWSRLQEVAEQIRKIHVEIGEGSPEISENNSDLSTRKLEELHKKLEMLQNEKADRLKQVIDHLSTINSLCLVLGMDFRHTVGCIHPSLADSEGVKDFSKGTIEMLAATIEKLQEVKRQRIHKLQDLLTSMLELWHLMDTPAKEQELFQNVTCNIAASEDEITETNSLSEDFINHIKAEVLRLEELKISKIRELIIRKKSELEEIRRHTHIVVEVDDAEYPVEAIESAAGIIVASLILEQIEVQIANAKEEAFSRKEILEKVDKWMAACEEESWLEEYNKDENRYSAGKGSHLILKRAEKARTTVSKIPAMVETLIAKTTTWENLKGVEFTYDGVRLLSMLEEYTIVRQEKEHDRRRQRDQRRLQGQIIAEKEVLFGSKPGSSKPQSAKKALKVSTGPPSNSSSRRLSMGGALLQPSRLESFQSPKVTPRSARKADNGEQVANCGFHKRQLSFNSSHTSDMEVLLARRPFTPIVPIPSPASLLDDNENKTTTIAPIVTPKTPDAMKTLGTPAAGHAVEDAIYEDEVEYSFEEQRAGFVLTAE